MKIESLKKALLRCASLIGRGLVAAGLLAATAAAPPATRSAAESRQSAQRISQQTSEQAATPVLPKEVQLTVDPVQSAVHWTLDTTVHTVHGTFALKRGAAQFDPATGKASGAVVADATSGKSGSDSRDKKMHQEVLESAKYSDVIFRPDRVEGKVAAHGPWTASVHGVFVLHGAEHELTVPAQGEFAGVSWKATAKFTIPFIQWGLKNPSNFLLKVNPEVDIEVDLTGSVQQAAAK